MMGIKALELKVDNKLTCDRVVTNVNGNCSVRKTKSKVVNELHGTEHFRFLAVLATR